MTSSAPPALPALPRPAVLAAIPAAGHVVVEASAGTGKTHTIEHLVVDLVLEGTPLDRLLVVTFTEKAAAELRRRVRALLGRALDLPPGPPPAGPCWTLDPARRARLERALHDLPQAAVLTIHGFCQRVLAEHAFLAGRPFAPALVAAEEVFAAAFGRRLRGAFAVDPALRDELAAWLELRDLEALRTLLGEAGARCPDLSRLRPELDLGALRAAAEALVPFAAPESLDFFLGQAEGALHGQTFRAVRQRFATLRELAEAWRRRPALLTLLVRLAETRPAARDLGFLVGRRTELVEAAPALGPLLERLAAVWGRRASLQAGAARLFLPAVRAEEGRAKRALGAQDFGDMILALRDALRDGAAGERLVHALRERFTHALIDEFQDTDEAQWEVFRRVFVDGGGPHRLWLVGDPKQAIYGFRGADVYAYRAARDLVDPGGARRVRLRECWRATPRLIAAYNHLFDQAAARPVFADDGPSPYDAPVTAAPRQRPLVARRGQAGPEVAPIHLLHLEDPDQELRAAEVRARLGRRLAREVRALVDGPVGLWVVDRDHADGRLRRVRWGDVFVLTGTSADARALAPHLRAAGVPFAFYKADGLLQTDEARDVAALLAAIADPRDPRRRRRAWLTPFFGLRPEELPRADAAGGDHPLLRRLFAWHRLAERGAWTTLFERVLADSGALRRELALVGQERALTNVLHLLELVAERAAAERLGPEEVATLAGAWVSGARAPAGEDPDLQRLETEADAVQLLTLHGSKGLEAEVVFVFGAFTDPRRRDVHAYHEPDDDDGVVVVHDAEGRRVVHVGPMDRDTQARADAERAEESKRLLYVAVTRARSRLYLPSFGQRPGRNNRLCWDFPWLGGHLVHLAPRLLEVVQEHDAGARRDLFTVERLGPAQAPAPAAADVAAACASWSPPPEAELPPPVDVDAYQARRRAHAGRLVTSYSRLARAGLGGAAGSSAGGGAAGEAPEGEAPEGEAWEEADAPAVAQPAAPDALRGGREVGSFLHRVLELAPFEAALATDDPAAWGELPAVADAVRRAGYRYPVDRRALPAARRLLHGALRTPVTLGAATLAQGFAAAGDGRKELPFVFPLPGAADAGRLVPDPDAPLVVERGWVRGVLDYVVVVEGRAWVVDWKSDLLPAWDAAHLEAWVAERYDLQRRLYALALAKLLQVRSAADHAARFGGVAYAFLRAMAPGAPAPAGLCAQAPSWDDLQAIEAGVRALDVEATA